MHDAVGRRTAGATDATTGLTVRPLEELTFSTIATELVLVGPTPVIVIGAEGVVVGGGVLGGGVLGAGDVTDSWAERRVVVGPVFATITKDLFPTGVAAEVCTTIIRSTRDVLDRTCADTPGARPTAVIENDEGERPPIASTS